MFKFIDKIYKGIVKKCYKCYSLYISGKRSKQNGGVVMSVNAVDLAKYIVNKCARNGHPISNLKLQKVLYNIQLEFLKKYKECAFSDDMEAWQYGPVIRNVYEEFWTNGAMPIEDFYNIEIFINNNERLKYLDQLIDQYTQMDSWTLVQDSHKQGTPWDRIYVPYKKRKIPVNLLIQYVAEHENE